ncbi:pyruvate decarboxylase 3-like [Apium graveolens]|uniref:pyruvate decarboxylase 3-like n=1 Tax=Apium graveolens TaxID=4045 RepID=UPI003D794E78
MEAFRCVDNIAMRSESNHFSDNGGCTIEVEMHDGPYNVIKNWNYPALVDAIHNGEGKSWTTKVRCEEDLVEIIETATGEKKRLSLLY